MIGENESDLKHVLRSLYSLFQGTDCGNMLPSSQVTIYFLSEVLSFEEESFANRRRLMDGKVLLHQLLIISPGPETVVWRSKSYPVLLNAIQRLLKSEDLRERRTQRNLVTSWRLFSSSFKICIFKINDILVIQPGFPPGSCPSLTKHVRFPVYFQSKCQIWQGLNCSPSVWSHC